MSVFKEVADKIAEKAVEEAKQQLQKEYSHLCACPLPGCTKETVVEENK